MGALLWLAGLPGKVKEVGIAVIVALAAIGGVYLKARSDGVRAVEAEQATKRAKAIEDRKKSDESVENLGSADVDQHLSKWMRDH